MPGESIIQSFKELIIRKKQSFLKLFVHLLVREGKAESIFFFWAKIMNILFFVSITESTKSFAIFLLSLPLIYSLI